MLIGSQTNYVCEHFGDLEGLNILRNAGFGSVDLNLFDWTPVLSGTDEDLEKLLNGANNRYVKMKRKGDEIGIKFGQVHAPFPTYKFNGDDNYNIHAKLCFAKAIEVCGILDCPYIVIHPIKSPTRIYDEEAEEMKKINMEYFSAFFPLFKKYNVKLGIENMWARPPHSKAKIVTTACSTAEEMCDYIDTLNEMAGFEVAVACLDIGHSNLTGDTPWNMIKILNGRLRLLHTHDTYAGVDKHTAPYLGDIDWDRTFAALKEINYSGEISFEADTFFATFGKELINESAHMLCRIGEVLCEKHDLT